MKKVFILAIATAVLTSCNKHSNFSNRVVNSNSSNVVSQYNDAMHMLVILFLSSCGSKVRYNEISGITSFHPSNSEREMYITSYGNMILSRLVQNHSGAFCQNINLRKGREIESANTMSCMLL